MKKLIYYIIPILVTGATLLGRLYWGYIEIELSAFDWIYSDKPVSDSIWGTIIYIIPMLLVFIYLIWMWRRNRKGIKYSFIQQLLLIVAFAFFIETFINGIILVICLGEEGGAMLAVFGFTNIFTFPFTLFISYLWIILNNSLDKEAIRPN